MAGLALVWPSRADRWRKPTIVAASIAVHALVLAFLGLRAIQMDGLDGDIFPPPPILVQLEPRPLLPGEAARVRQAPLPDTPVPSVRIPGSPTAPAALPIRNPLDEDEEDRPSPPVPRAGAPAPGAAAPPADVGVGAWTVRPETMGDRVGRGLRTRGPGCSSPQLLTQAERAICEDHFGERAAAAAPISGTGNPERDARFAREGARALAEYEARRRPLAGGVGVVGPQDGPGSNFGMGVAGAHLDPSFRPDSTENIRTNRRDGPR